MKPSHLRHIVPRTKSVSKISELLTFFVVSWCQQPSFPLLLQPSINNKKIESPQTFFVVSWYQLPFIPYYPGHRSTIKKLRAPNLLCWVVVSTAVRPPLPRPSINNKKIESPKPSLLGRGINCRSSPTTPAIDQQKKIESPNLLC